MDKGKMQQCQMVENMGLLMVRYRDSRAIAHLTFGIVGVKSRDFLDDVRRRPIACVVCTHFSIVLTICRPSRRHPSEIHHPRCDYWR